MKRLLLVDGHGYAYRAFHAIRELRSPDGRPTNAIFGFIKMLGKAREMVPSSHVAVIWDGGLDATRTESLPGYKAQRPEMPDALEQQLDGIVEYLKASGIQSVCHDGVEADDLIATIEHQVREADVEVVIATGDKDFMQLVGEWVRLLNPGDKVQPVWGAEQVTAKTGVRPDQVVDWLSLMGDSVDNIPGVPGVGPKTATRLLNEFESVDVLLNRLDQVKPDRMRGALEGAADQVRRNRDLVRLKDDVAGAPTLAECELGRADNTRLLELFNRWGFKTLARTVSESEDRQGMLL